MTACTRITTCMQPRVNLQACVCVFVYAAEKASSDESRYLYEQRKEVEELHRELNDKDLKIDDMIEQFQAQLKVRRAVRPSSQHDAATSCSIAALHTNIMGTPFKCNTFILYLYAANFRTNVSGERT